MDNNTGKIIKKFITACFAVCIFSSTCFASDQWDFGGRIDEVRALAESDSSVEREGLVVHGIIPDAFFDENIRIGKMRHALLKRRWTQEEINSFRSEFMPARLLPREISESAIKLFCSSFRDVEDLEDCFWDNEFLESMNLFADIIEIAIDQKEEDSCYSLEGNMWNYMHNGEFSQIVRAIEDKCQTRDYYKDERDLTLLRMIYR